MKIRVDENIPMGREAFSEHGEVDTFAGRSLTRRDLAEADALIVRSITRVDAALLDGTPVRFVGTATIGTDHVDQAYLAGRGIGFSAAPGCNADSVGEYFAAAITHLETRKGFGLEGKTLGIIGHGHVGARVEEKAKALGMRVLKYDPPKRDAARDTGGDHGAYSELPELLERCDILSLHVPLIKTGPYPTLRLADTAFFSRLSRPIVLLNTCRGEVIDEAALTAALDTGKIRHLVLDVFAGEPRIDQRLAARADLITPHIAGYSLPGKLNGTTQIAEAFRRHFGFGTRWAPRYPEPADPELAYSESDADAAFIHRCIAAAYDITADNARLRTSFRDADPGKAFDRLRRDYPVRHDFASYRITRLPQGKRELRSRLLDLGFRIV